MKRYFFSLCVALTIVCSAQSQSNATDKEIDRVSQLLTRTLNSKKIKKIAVADFTYQGQELTRIGKYIADELSLGLTMNGGGFNVVSRDVVRQELYRGKEAGATVDYETLGKGGLEMMKRDSTKTKNQKQEDLIDMGGAMLSEATKLIGSKKLRGTDVIISGTIEDRGDNLRVIIEMVRNKRNKTNIGGARGNFTKTPEIRELMYGRVEAPRTTLDIVEEPDSEFTQDVPGITFKKENILFEVIGCRQEGRVVECDLNIFSSNTDDVLFAYKNGTRIIDAGNSHEFHAIEMRLADVSGTGRHIDKSLVADVPIEATFRFGNVNQDVSSIARMDIQFWAQKTGGSLAQLNNIPVR